MLGAEKRGQLRAGMDAEPIRDVPEFVAAKRAEGLAVDVKLLLLLAESLLVQG